MNKLKQQKTMETRTSKVIATFDSFNHRRYSSPWVGRLKNGKYVFDVDSLYTGNAREGEKGDLVVIAPTQGTVYAYGQKDYRGGRTIVEFAIFDGSEFRGVTREEAMRASLN